MYYIYCIRNKTNDKCYVGQTISIDNRLKRHFNSNDTRIGREIQKLGKENFEVKIIDYAQSKKEANKKETENIIKYNCIIPNGYNKNIAGQADKVKGKPVYQYDLKGNFIKKYENISDASQQTKTSRTSILACLVKTYKKANNFLWSYSNSKEEIELLVKRVPIQRVKVAQYDENMNFIKEYSSCAEAGRQLGLKPKAYKVIFKVLDEPTRKAYNFYWKRI